MTGFLDWVSILVIKVNLVTLAAQLVQPASMDEPSGGMSRSECVANHHHGHLLHLRSGLVSLWSELLRDDRFVHEIQKKTEA